MVNWKPEAVDVAAEKAGIRAGPVTLIAGAEGSGVLGPAVFDAVTVARMNKPT
jgi:hypothetical protein